MLTDWYGGLRFGRSRRIREGSENDGFALGRFGGGAPQQKREPRAAGSFAGTSCFGRAAGAIAGREPFAGSGGRWGKANGEESGVGPSEDSLESSGDLFHGRAVGSICVPGLLEEVGQGWRPGGVQNGSLVLVPDDLGKSARVYSSKWDFEAEYLVEEDRKRIHVRGSSVGPTLAHLDGHVPEGPSLRRQSPEVVLPLALLLLLLLCSS